MNKKEILLERLEAIGKALQSSQQALALLGLGSVGIERQRMDEFSDLDFFVIARDGFKDLFIKDISWLHSVHPIGYAFQNTVDGYKVLFEDGVYCEFGVFEPHELEHIPYTGGQLVWKTPEFDERLAWPRKALPVQQERTPEWLLGEALTCLYVGLLRFRRGEKLSAFRLMQVFALDRIMELAAFIEKENGALRDVFAPERRFEERFPETAKVLASCMQGYDAAPQSALALLHFLETHFEIDAWIKAAILEQAAACEE